MLYNITRDPGSFVEFCSALLKVWSSSSCSQYILISSTEKREGDRHKCKGFLWHPIQWFTYISLARTISHATTPSWKRGRDTFFFFGTEHCHSQHNHTIRFSKKEKKIDTKWAISSIRHIQGIFVPGFASSSKIILNMMTLLLAS